MSLFLEAKYSLPTIFVIALLQFVSLFTTNWSVVSGDNGDVMVGLFGVKMDNGASGSMSMASMATLRAAQAFAIMGALCSIAALVAAVRVAKWSSFEVLPHLGLVNASLLFTFIADMIWVGGIKPNLGDSDSVMLSYSYWLSLSSVLVGILVVAAHYYKTRGLYSSVRSIDSLLAAERSASSFAYY